MDQHQERGRFLSDDDFYDFRRGEIPEMELLLDSFITLFKDIIRPLVDNVYPDLVQDLNFLDTEDKENNVINFRYGCGSATSIDENNDLDLSKIIGGFERKRKQLVNGIRFAMEPAVSGDILLDHDLSEDQFLIKLIRSEIVADSMVYENSGYNGEVADVWFGIFIHIYVTIEDISELEPDGREMSRVRFNNLCGATGERYPLEELKAWAAKLGIKDWKQMTKQDACLAIKEYYDF